MNLINILGIATCLGLTSSAFASSTYVYCGVPDGSDWEWLLDTDDNYISIEGEWKRVTLNDSSYFNVFNVSESVFNQRTWECPAGYVVQPADRSTSFWEVFQITREDGSSYLKEGHKSYHNSMRYQDHFLRSL
ncbi:hypothetical protein ACODM8_14810 [Vibrio ostreicida]|uniref:hypothetical protein n=1 Tax=Vibrio ostreicida TaxID=526588 RepID=UPI003B5B11D3